MCIHYQQYAIPDLNFGTSATGPDLRRVLSAHVHELEAACPADDRSGDFPNCWATQNFADVSTCAHVAVMSAATTAVRTRPDAL